MASYGTEVLRGSISRRAAQAAVLSGLLALLLLDYALFVPFPTQSLRVPDLYQTLQADEGSYGILDVGTERFNHEGMYFQTVHQHPLAGVHLPLSIGQRVLPEVLRAASEP